MGKNSKNSSPANHSMEGSQNSDEQHALTRTHAFVGGKTYKRQHLLCEEDPRESEEAEGPDLEAYLAEWDLADKEKIALCRTYASYLTAKLKAQQK